MPNYLTVPRLKLLRALDGVEGGKLPAEWLSVPSRRLGTQMQGDGLVEWRVNGGIGSRHTCKGQTLYITDAGRAALTNGRPSND